MYEFLAQGFLFSILKSKNSKKNTFSTFGLIRFNNLSPIKVGSRKFLSTPFRRFPWLLIKNGLDGPKGRLPPFPCSSFILVKNKNPYLLKRAAEQLTRPPEKVIRAREHSRRCDGYSPRRYQTTRAHQHGLLIQFKLLLHHHDEHFTRKKQLFIQSNFYLIRVNKAPIHAQLNPI